MSATIAACRNHPDREALGICVRCKARVCGECTTKVDGINHCVDCLAALGGAGEEKRAARSSGGVVQGLATFAWFGLLSGLIWVLLEVALPGSSRP